MQLPLAAYLVSQLASKRATSGPAELAGLAFGSVTFMGAAACCFELLHMGDDMVSQDKKASLLYGTYLPFAVIRKFHSHLSEYLLFWLHLKLLTDVAALLAVDMYLRLLPRVQESGKKAKSQ